MGTTTAYAAVASGGRALAAAQGERSLPVPPWAVALGALVVFGLLLALTWSFRESGRKH